MKPHVSFVVPCFNYARYLTQCLAAIQAQTFTDFEILICDDASTDETPDLAAALCAQDDRIRYIRHPQSVGHLENYNRGICQAEADLLWLISADDALASPTLLENYVTAFKDNPDLTLAVCRAQCMDEDAVAYDKFIPRLDYPGLPERAQVCDGTEFYRLLIQANFVASPSALAKKSEYEKFGYFHPKLTHSGDWYNWLLFALDGQVYYDPQPGVFYRKHQQDMHVTYERPQHAIDNSLLCYDLLLAQVPDKLKHTTRLARIQYKKQHQQALTVVEKAQRTLAKITGKL